MRLTTCPLPKSELAVGTMNEPGHTHVSQKRGYKRTSRHVNMSLAPFAGKPVADCSDRKAEPARREIRAAPRRRAAKPPEAAGHAVPRCNHTRR